MEVLLSAVLILVALSLLAVIVMGVFYFVDLFFETPYIATKRNKIPTIIKLSAVKKGETVVDLGAGDGRLLFAFAKEGAKAIGYELNPFLIFKTNLLIFLKRVKNITFLKENYWKSDISKADIIIVYAMRTSMKKFEDFVYKNAKKRARIIVNTNPFPNKKPFKEEASIFLYKV